MFAYVPVIIFLAISNQLDIFQFLFYFLSIHRQGLSPLRVERNRRQNTLSDKISTDKTDKILVSVSKFCPKLLIQINLGQYIFANSEAQKKPSFPSFHNSKFRQFCPTKIFVRRKFCPSKFCPIRYLFSVIFPNRQCMYNFLSLHLAGFYESFFDQECLCAQDEV